MPLFCLFCCNLDPDPDFVPDAEFDQDGSRYTKLTVMYHYWPLFAVKLHYLSYFAVIRIQIWIFDAHAHFDLDKAKYTELTVKYFVVDMHC